MNPAILNSQFVQVALPIVITLFMASWLNNKAIDALGKRIDDLRGDFNNLRGDFNNLRGEFNGLRNSFELLRSDMNRRFDRLETIVGDHGERVTRLEERTSPLSIR